MEHTVLARSEAWPAQAPLSSAPWSASGSGCPQCKRQTSPEARLLRGLGRLVVGFVEDMEALFVPWVALADRHPRVVTPARVAPSVAVDRSAAEATAFLTRGIPQVGTALDQWLSQQGAGSIALGPTLFRTPAWTPLTAQLADLVVADCGPALSALLEDTLTRARIAILASSRALTLPEQKNQLLSALAIALAQAFRQGLLSERLRPFLCEVREAVTQWAVDHQDWRQSGAFAVSNILIACGLRCAVSQLRQRADAQFATAGAGERKGHAIGERKSTPPAKADGGHHGGLDRRTLLAWLETFCLDLGSDHDRFEAHDLQLATSLKKTHQIIQQYCATLGSGQAPIRPQGPTALAVRLAHAHKGHRAARVAPLRLQPLPASDPSASRRTSDTRPATPGDPASDDFLPGRLQKPDAPSPTMEA